MKKGLILAAALVLAATSAMASSVVDSKHNINRLGPAVVTNPSQEVCVFCHTPHAAVANDNAPLWNRSNTVTSGFILYNSATLDKANSYGAAVSTAIGRSDAPLCLSCHDGSAITQALNNEPNAGAVTWANPAYVWSLTTADIGEGSLDLSNDHPIGMIYRDVYAADTNGFNDPAVVTSSLTVYDGGRMWCSTCHDVHDDAFTPFLATINTGSALCVTCHNK